MDKIPNFQIRVGWHVDREEREANDGVICAQEADDRNKALSCDAITSNNGRAIDQCSILQTRDEMHSACHSTTQTL